MNTKSFSTGKRRYRPKSAGAILRSNTRQQRHGSSRTDLAPQKTRESSMFSHDDDPGRDEFETVISVVRRRLLSNHNNRIIPHDQVSFEEFLDVGKSFIAENLDPRYSTNFKNKRKDDWSLILLVLGHCLDDEGWNNNEYSLQIILTCLKIIKILSRKLANRQNVDDNLAFTLSCILRKFNSEGYMVKECANIILNVCYEKHNILYITTSGCINLLLRCMDQNSENIQCYQAVAGALQSICYQKEGKEYLRKANGIPVVVKGLNFSQDIKVLKRTIGTLHNLSSDLSCALAISAQPEAIPELVRWVKKDSYKTLVTNTFPSEYEDLEEFYPSVAGSAAACLQNLSRDDKARDRIVECGAIDPLSELLFHNDTDAQVCAIGALLNIVSNENEEGKSIVRDEFKTLLSMSIITGILDEFT
eukprot:gb/GECH01012443.1/.p1 GENE.gb/GECH01012443.1/~~gb/GECH01012443.1/.p1  ORF type:complete len:418 (+),score=40.77 gb/GECH01012443.1/:1-1254(+)